MQKLKKQTLDGNVETILLSTLDKGPSYGYAIVQEINAHAQGVLQLGEGTIYPVLHRLEDRGLIAATWRTAENGRDRKYYRITPKGKKALVDNCRQWELLSLIMSKVVKLNPPESLQGA